MTNKPVIVLGLGPAGLFLVRQLSKITTNIYAVGRPDDVGMYSRYIKKNKRYYAVTADALASVFEEIGAREGQKPELHICSDQYLSILIENKDRWETLAELPGADFNTLSLINDKNMINAYCQKHGIMIPASVPISTYRKAPFFPVIIKWVEKRIETAVNPLGKVRICRNEQEFEVVERAIRKGRIQDSELFAQSYIEGRNDSQYSVGGYFQAGEVLADVVVNQIKQQPQGITAEAVTVTAGSIYDNLYRITRSFANVLGYSGFLEMEYKVDAVSGKLYLLDVNPRPWGWVSIMGTVYADFYQVLNGSKPASEYQNTVWKSPMRILTGKKNPQNVELKDACRAYALAYDIKDRQDPKPSAAIYLMAVKKILRKVKR